VIEQYLSNTNEIATGLILPKILELNKALTYKHQFFQRSALRQSSKQELCSATLHADNTTYLAASFSRVCFAFAFHGHGG